MQSFSTSVQTSFQSTAFQSNRALMPKILLIDDEPRIVQDMLKLYGYEVDLASNGFDGIQKLLASKNVYDLVILDLQMPKMNGWSVLKTLRSSTECPNIPVIILSSCDQEDSVVAGLRRGADEYLTKPITPNRLLAHIEAVLRRAQSSTPVPAAGESELGNEGFTAAIRLLTPRENEILEYLVKGLSNQDIGKTLVISETTVKNHLAHIFKKLNVSNRTQAAYIAQKLSV